MRPHHRCGLIALPIAWSLLAACDPPDGAGASPDTAADTPTDADAGDTVHDTDNPVLGGRCADDVRLGGFEVLVTPEYSSIQGSVASGVVPGSIRENAFEEAGCTLWKKPILDCNPPCPVDDTCDVDGTCIPYPLNQDLGTVVIEGLNKNIAMAPSATGNNYFDTDLPHPIFDANNPTIRLTTATGFLGGMVLHGTGSDTIVPVDGALVVEEGRDLVVHWDPPPEGAPTTVFLSLMIDQHGSTPVSLECALEDTGEGTVPAGVIDALIDAGVTGFPTGSIFRGTVDSVRTAEGCVDFSVKSYRPVEVTVAGYIPCTGPGTCEAGQTCNPVSYICE